MKTQIIYHANCNDGFGAAFAAWLHFAERAEYWAASHGAPAPDVMDKHVYILDFSYPKAIMKQIAAQAAQVTILDHHQSAADDLAELLETGVINGFFDLARSGAMISWEYFHSTPAPQLIRHIQDKDLWRFELPGTQEVSMALQTYPKTFAAWSPLMADSTPLLHAGKPIYAFFQQQVEALQQLAFTMNIGGYQVPVVNAPAIFASDLGNRLAQHAPFAAVFFECQSMLNFSLRSTDAGVDVATLATRFGGGGHRNAAGFRIPKTDRHLLAAMGG